MASSLDKNYKRIESRNKHSWWWDSHISSKNSKWLAENIEEMDQSVKRMLKLIEEDGDSFAKKAEMYYQKRPQLISHVEEFYRMYRSLAERYDNITGELKKNIPSDLQSQGSGISDVGSDPPAISNPRARTARRAAGFDFFLKSGGSSSDLVTKEGDETSTLDSETESDDSSVNNYSIASANSDHKGLCKRINELENELQKIQMQQQENIKINNAEELLLENEKLKTELKQYESIVSRSDDNEDEKNPTLEVDVKIMREKVKDSEEEVKKLKHELENNGSLNHNLQEKLVSAHKEILGWKSKLEREKRGVLKLQERITRYKTNLSDRDREIRAMRETLSNANIALSEENMQLQEQVTKLSKERVLLDDTIKEWDLRCQISDEELRRMKNVKTELEDEIEKLKYENDELVVKVNELDHQLTLKDDQIDGLGQHLDQLHVEHIELVDRVEKSKKSIDELTCRSEELENEVSRQRGLIKEQAEEKREAIRQLCFSLEYHRDRYQTMRQTFMGYNKRHAVMAS